MSAVAMPAEFTGAMQEVDGALVESWGGGEQLARVLGALRGCLADDTLPPLPAEVRALVKDVTWYQVANTMRLAESSQWRGELTVAKSAMGHQMLWLLVGCDSPSPRGLPGRHHATLRSALSRVIAEPFEAEAKAQAQTEARKAAGKRDLPAARAAVASRLPWSAPADVLVLRALMTDPTGAAAKLGAALRAAGPPCALLTLPPTQSCTPPARPMSSRAVQYCVTGRRGSTPPQHPPAQPFPPLLSHP